MKRLIQTAVFFWATVFWWDSCYSAPETSVRGTRAGSVLKLIWQSELAAAADSGYRIVYEESLNPLGYFLLGMVYYSISTQFRTDRYLDSVTWNLDRAIELAKMQVDTDGAPAESYFLLGSAYGCRALYRSMHGGWWGAFRDGHHSCVNLEEAYRNDSSLTDALMGIGAYHYWKSAKSKSITWLPFVGDKREKGLAELRRAIDAQGIMSPNAYRALLPIYYHEKRYEDALLLSDTLAAAGLFDTNCQLHTIRCLIELEKWDRAEELLLEVRVKWEASPYADSCSFSELQLLQAQILAGSGHVSRARTLLKNLLQLKDACDQDAYFQDTRSRANKVLRQLSWNLENTSITDKIVLATFDGPSVS